MGDNVTSETKRKDGKYNVKLTVDGEDHMIMGLSAGVDVIEFIKAQNKARIIKELDDVKESINTWRNHQPMEGITQEDIDLQLLEFNVKKEALEIKAVRK